MNPSQPNEFPELWLMVARNLFWEDQKACALVSKAWHGTFIPHVWTTLTLDFDFHNLSHSRIRRDCEAPKPCVCCQWSKAIKKHGRYVRHLKVLPKRDNSRCRELFQVVVDHCTALTELTYPRPQPCSAHYLSSEDLLRELIKRNPLIQSLSTGVHPCLEQAMASLPNLRTLRVQTFSLSVMDAVSVLASFPHLQELDLLASLCLAPALKATRTLTNDSTQTQAQVSLLSSPSSSPLKRLKLAFSGVIGATGLAPLLLRCPNLTHLDFGGVRALDIPTLQVLVSRNLLYWLTSLTIGRYAYDGTAQLILQALGRTQRLRRLCLGNPTEPTLEVLSKHHGQHLEQLTLVDFNCAAVSPMVVLATCTALKTFVITSMQGMPLDVRKVVDQPWACTQLESLKMPLSLELRSNQALLAQEGRRRAAKVDNISDNDARMLSEWREAEMALMERLGTLTQLRELRLMARKKSRLTSGDSMSWRLTTGLDRLQDLDRLEVLDLGLRPYVQTMREFQWMKEHWTSLKRLVIYRFDNAQRRAWFRHEWPEVKVVELCRKRRSR